VLISFLKKNEYLKKDIPAIFHSNYHAGNPELRNKIGTVENIICTLKNDFQDRPDRVLEQAASNLHQILEQDFSEILKETKSDHMVVCLVPRSKSENNHTEKQLLFRSVVSTVANKLDGFSDGTQFIIRHTDTQKTHLFKSGHGGDGDMPYPGITIKTCAISPDVKGKNILFIDDLYTKDVNIDEDAVQALLDNGAKAVLFYALGITVKRGNHSTNISIGKWRKEVQRLFTPDKIDSLEKEQKPMSIDASHADGSKPHSSNDTHERTPDKDKKHDGHVHTSVDFLEKMDLINKIQWYHDWYMGMMEKEYKQVKDEIEFAKQFHLAAKSEVVQRKRSHPFKTILDHIGIPSSDLSILIKTEYEAKNRYDNLASSIKVYAEFLRRANAEFQAASDKMKVLHEYPEALRNASSSDEMNICIEQGAHAAIAIRDTLKNLDQARHKVLESGAPFESKFDRWMESGMEKWA